MMLSISKSGYEQRVTWVLEGIKALEEEHAWAEADAYMQESRVNEAREVVAIISRIRV